VRKRGEPPERGSIKKKEGGKPVLEELGEKPGAFPLNLRRTSLGLEKMEGALRTEGIRGREK